MDSQHSVPHQNGHLRSPVTPMTSHPLAMDLDHEDVRTHRAASVLSGMSQEDMEAAETLKSLQANYRSASDQQPPRLIRSRTTYSPNDQPEPLFSLLTSQFPLTASMINRSLSVYRGTQSLIPGAYTVEQNVGLPLASMLGRVTGVEGGIRWALQPKRRDSSFAPSPVSQKIDVETGMAQSGQGGVYGRRSSAISEQLPPYDDIGRSPPYQEHQLVPQTRDGQTPPGWRAQLVISTSGLGIAMSEESLRSLRYCLSWLKWANERLGGVILSLNEVLKRWEEAKHQELLVQSDSTCKAKPSQAAMAQRIQELKGVVLQTLKQVVDVVSNYAGGALPENARNLVHRHITSLPLRFRLASSMATEENGDNGNAHRVMMLAQEGLNMMGQVSGVVNDTLVSAESWCEKLGRHQGQQQPQPSREEAMLDAGNENGVQEPRHIEHIAPASGDGISESDQMDVDLKVEE